MALRPTRFESTYPVGENATPGGKTPSIAHVELNERHRADGPGWVASARVDMIHALPGQATKSLVGGLRTLADKLEGEADAYLAFEAQAVADHAASAPKSKR